MYTVLQFVLRAVVQWQLSVSRSLSSRTKVFSRHKFPLPRPRNQTHQELHKTHEHDGMMTESRKAGLGVSGIACAIHQIWAVEPVPCQQSRCLQQWTCGSRVLTLIAKISFTIYILLIRVLRSLLTSSDPVASLGLLINTHSFFSAQPSSSFVLSHLRQAPVLFTFVVRTFSPFILASNSSANHFFSSTPP